MSYKLYEAYKVPYDGTVFGLKSVVESIRSDLVTLLKIQELKTMVENAVSFYDHRATRLVLIESADEGTSKIGSAWRAAQESALEKKRLFSEQDQILLLFIDQESPTSFFLIPFGMEGDLLEGTGDLLLDQYQAQDYGYWDSSDRPDEMSNSEWKERHDTWERIGVGEGTPADHGWKVRILSRHDKKPVILSSDDEIYNVSNANSLIPSFETRMNRVIFRKMRKISVAKLRKREDDDGTEYQLYDYFNESVTIANKIQENTSDVEEARNVLMDYLLVEITMDNLFP